MILVITGFAAVPTNAVDPAPPIQRPVRLMYGFGDASLADWTETLGVMTVVTGQTTNAALVRDLRKRGVIFAYHVTNTPTEQHKTAADFVEYWSQPFQNTLDGQLPGGFDAISIDELHSSPDGSEGSQRTVAALRQLREKFPRKYIFAWSVWRLADGGPGAVYNKGKTFDALLHAARDYCDLFILECYIREGNPQFYLFERFARNLAERAPGILEKTLFGLYISQSEPFIADDAAELDFKDFLDEQFHLAANSKLCQPIAGLAFWPFYRARSDTRAAVNALVRHYIMGGQKSYFGDGDYKQLVANPSFERSDRLAAHRYGENEAWEFEAGQDGTAAIVDYADLKDAPDKHGSVSHGKRCLLMARGAVGNTARQTLSLKPDAWYTASVFCLVKAEDASLPKIRAMDSAGVLLASQDGARQYDKWQIILSTFRTRPDSGAVAIQLSDAALPEGAQSFWDFVELEEAKGINQPTSITGVRVSGDRRTLFLEGESFMPGSSARTGKSKPVTIQWKSPTSVEIHLPMPIPVGEHTLVIEKPKRCLHPHVCSVQFKAE